MKITVRYHVTPLRVAIIKNIKTTHADKGVEKLESLCTTDGSVKRYIHA